MVRFQISMSVDGFTAGPDQSVEQPLGRGGEALHQWLFPTRTFRSQHGGGEGGETGPDDEVAVEVLGGGGAFIMGRNMYGPIRGEWGDSDWRGWWGPDPPYHAPVFVLTHHPREPVEMEGGTTFQFVTGGVDEALKRAMAAAGERDVIVMGGANVGRQYLRAGVVDRIDIHVSPMLLGGGERLFDDVGDLESRYQVTRVLSTPRAMHVRWERIG